MSARKGLVVVRSGKGDAYREVPLNALARHVLEEWLKERGSRATEGERAVFVGSGGRRLSKRSVDDVVRGLGEDAGVSLSAPVLRHTFLTGWSARDRIWCWWPRWRGTAGWRRPAATACRRTSTGCWRSRICRSTTDGARCRPGFSPTLRSSGWSVGRRRPTSRISPATSISTTMILTSFAGSTVRPGSLGSAVRAAVAGFRPGRPDRRARGNDRRAGRDARSAAAGDVRVRGAAADAS